MWLFKPPWSSTTTRTDTIHNFWSIWSNGMACFRSYLIDIIVLLRRSFLIAQRCIVCVLHVYVAKERILWLLLSNFQPYSSFSSRSLMSFRDISRFKTVVILKIPQPSSVNDFFTLDTIEYQFDPRCNKSIVTASITTLSIKLILLEKLHQILENGCLRESQVICVNKSM